MIPLSRWNMQAPHKAVTPGSSSFILNNMLSFSIVITTSDRAKNGKRIFRRGTVCVYVNQCLKKRSVEDRRPEES
ncbi:hypothetical protein LguiA_002016 [Lonicera macranthoides]